MNEEDDTIDAQRQRFQCIGLLKNSAQQYVWGDTQGITPFVEAHPVPVILLGRFGWEATKEHPLN